MRPALALLPLSLVLAACGGGGDRLSAAEYREQADAICEQANEDLRNVPEPQSPDDLDGFVDESKPIIEDAVGELDDLEPPEELADAHERWMDRNRELVSKLDDLKDAQVSEIEAKANEFADLNDEANEIARNDLGLDACGEEG